MSTRALRTKRSQGTLPIKAFMTTSSSESKMPGDTTANAPPTRGSAASTAKSSAASKRLKGNPDDGLPRYWLLVASRDHVRSAIEGGFCQANHGKRAPLERMRRGDGVVFYSGRETLVRNGKGAQKGEVCQRFTGIGRVSGEEVWQVKAVMRGKEGFEPWRRGVDFERGEDGNGTGAREVEIKPLIERLECIRDKKHWGASLRFGFLKIGEGDWKVIQKAMVGGEGVS